MFQRIKQAIIPHMVGLFLMVLGWWISLLNVGLDKFSSNNLLFNFWTLLGLSLIIIGAYLPETWVGLRSIGKKEEPLLKDTKEKEEAPLIRDVTPPQIEKK
jgi:hypothetical protein